MKRIAVLIVSLASAATMWAQAPAPAAAPTKIAVINIQEAILSTSEGKTAEAALQQRFQPKRTELENSNKELQALQQRLQAGGNTMSADAKAELSRNIETKQRDLQRSAEDAQSDFQAAQNEVVNRIGTKMMPIISAYAQSHGLSAIFDISLSWPQNPVLFASPGATITQAIVKLYDQQHPATAAAAPAKQ